MSYEIDLRGKVAIVTGAAGGIGFGIAEVLAKAGAQVVIDDLSPEEKVNDKLDTIDGIRPAYYTFNLANEDDCKQLVHQVVSEFGRVDILVNNAVTDKGWDLSWEVNVKAVFTLSEAVKEDMKKRNYGKIVNITSSAVISGGSPYPFYAATKGAVDSMTRYLAKRYAQDGILMNAVAPGPVATELMKNRYDSQKMLEHYIPQIPIGRLSTPEDIAKIVLFLSSDMSDILCGHTILADGGRTRLGIK